MTDGQRNRLLVIDDNEAIHADFEKIFAPRRCDSELMSLDAELFGDDSTLGGAPDGYELHFASQGRQGLEILRESTGQGKTFGAAFVDMRMPPGWDGVQTIEHLWEIDPDLQVVICTAFSDHSWDTIAKKFGRTDKLLVLKKPFDEIEAVQLATSLCEKRRLLEHDRQRMSRLKEVVASQESKLQSAHLNAELLIASIPSLLICLDENGRVSRWNPCAETVFEVSTADAIGKRLADLPIRWSDHQRLKGLLSDETPQEHLHNELQFVDRYSTQHTIDVRVCQLNDDATSFSTLIVGTDVTKQRFIQSQLDQSQRLESVGQLAAGVAHEINTPMQYIGDNVRYVAKTLDRLAGLIECLPALVDETISDERLIEIRNSLSDCGDARKIRSSLRQIPEALTDSIEGVEAVSKIVAAMKEFSHPGTDEKIQLCINHILQSTIAVARNEWKYIADVETDLKDNLTPIYGLPSELNQAFLNIIINAAHAIGERVERKELEKGTITVRTTETEDGVQVTVADNGCGIPDYAKKRVFEPFFTTKDVGKGTGQGLAIAHSVIVQKHQGKLWFDSQEGEGTTFTIQIPRNANNASEAEDALVAGRH